MDHYRTGLELIQRCATEPDVAGLITEFLALLPGFGFHSAAGGAWTGIGRTAAYRFYFNSWPADWLELYNERNFFHDDPLIIESKRRMAPFRWTDLSAYEGHGPRAAEMLALAYEYGWCDGLAIPVHGPAGYQGIISLAAMQPLDLRPGDISLLWVVALAVHARCRTTAGLGQSSSPLPTLTPRELECMRWVASGKTEWEIAVLLSIAPSTVHFHVERVKKRLATSSRTHAVALLVLHGAL